MPSNGANVGGILGSVMANCLPDCFGQTLPCGSMNAIVGPLMIVGISKG